MSARSSVPELDRWLAPRWSRSGAAVARAATLPRGIAAAIRVPERLSAQLALVFPSAAPQLFVHEGARQALERRLKAACPGRPVVLSITDNRHSIISHALKSGVLHARIHHMFLDAPPQVIDALVRYVARDDRAASQIVGHYIEANGARLARRRPRAIPLQAKGDHHDLLSLFNELNQRYFDGGCHALITWGRRTTRRDRKPRQAIKLGSYSSLERLIRIHPVLDRPWVPRYFVAYVVYHEMLHHMIPSARGNARQASSNIASAKGQIARRVLHPPEFLERERHFRNFERALEWERRHIARLLRSPG
ncbi:MAG: hypothetical protein KIS78_19855 [Labilithrix sp.]|nr:hypothetical protein [Labilithrix sp.]MCW5834668.1 hypothetical protein [Labilithrix sp.]